MTVTVIDWCLSRPMISKGFIAAGRNVDAGDKGQATLRSLLGMCPTN